MNNTKSSMIGMKLIDAIKLDILRLDKTYPEDNMPPEAGLYRYLYQSGKQRGDQKRQATDFILNKNPYRSDQFI